MNRRGFIHSAGGLLLAMANPLPAAPAKTRQGLRKDSITLFFGGDVMTGRGLDQALPNPSDPELFERHVRDARDYLRLAERANGPIRTPVAFDYIWGDALAVLEQVGPDLRIVNLETAVTRHGEHWKDKGINYRMHPGNVPCLSAAGIDVCTLANNHVLDWRRPGLAETLDSLRAAGLRTVGAGRNLETATASAVMTINERCRVRVYSRATLDSGVFADMAAGPERSGMHVLPSLLPNHTQPVVDRIQSEKQPGDIVVASIHWGGNWDYFIPVGQRKFARDLVAAGVDIIHGHSSHHPKGIEVIDGRTVIYGCGDLINDYEGIEGGRESYRSELVLMYFVTVDAASGELRQLKMRPMRIRRLRLNFASGEESGWLRQTLHREGQRLNTAVEQGHDGFLELDWKHG
jgi:poly-gamma-glutamate synthesis protein (capsule biosynthesis protein)